MSRPRVHIRTFGCQMNVHDTRRLYGIMAAAGYDAADGPGDADLLLVNGCTVREKAWHKAISEAGRLRGQKRRREGVVVGVIGCVAQQEGARVFELLRDVDLAVAPDHYRQLPALVGEVLRDRRPRAVTGFDAGGRGDFLGAAGEGGEARPVSDFVTVMKGCEERCAYCIVPDVRGPERSRPADDIVAEVEGLVGQGVREVVLLGQKVNAWTLHGLSFAGLLERIDAVPGLARLRFVSPHPRHMEPDLAAAFGRLRTLCEAIHLPVQAGSDRTLAAMGRRYTREDYLAAAERLRASCPSIAISTDLIVGYPGETEADFERTLDLVSRVGFTGVFSFKYSPRPGTPAARLDDDVPTAEKERRLEAVHAVVRGLEESFRESLVGRMLEVLVEGPGRMPGQASGRARNNQIVNFTAPDGADADTGRGELVPVRITRANPHSLEGVIEAAP
jgi:tRNA-2-methylthio-N6-dimethylallyladenosine synthase